MKEKLEIIRTVCAVIGAVLQMTGVYLLIHYNHLLLHK